MINDILLLESLRKFYENEYYKKQLISILKNERVVSLRSIDWFITNYSKKNNIYYLIYETSKQRPTFIENNNLFRENLNVYHSYKSQLSAYSKKKFDPFCRRDRILFILDEENRFETTVGQLNFFKWALENKILHYIEQNLTKINNDMNNRNSTAKNRKEKSTAKTRKKREELSISASKSIKKEQVEIIVDFK